MKYALTTLTALSFGSASYRLAHFFGWHQWQERLFTLLTAVFAAALVCAHLWL